MPYQAEDDTLDLDAELTRRCEYLEFASAKLAEDAKALRQRLGRKAVSPARAHTASYAGLKVVKPTGTPSPAGPQFYAVATRQDARYLETAFRNQGRYPPDIVVLEDL